MQVISENEEEESYGGETDTVDFVIYTGELADVWKKNILEDLEVGILEYEMVGEFLMDIRKEFGGGDEEATKIAKLRRLE